MDGKLETPVNSLIKGRYLIQKVLGRGGLGSTYLALDARYLKKHYVLKEFAPNGLNHHSQQKTRALLKREAEILFQIHHPQIPNFLTCFEANGHLFLAQEYVQGKTYSTLMKEHLAQGQVLSEGAVIHLLAHLLPVLDYIHKRGVIHRDISPSNIMRTAKHNLPVLIDFGIGKHITEMRNDPADNDSSFISHMRKLSLVGKVGYAPYEQIELGICSPRSDLYALGVTAVVLLTGREPSFLVNQSSLQWQWQAYAKVSKAFSQILNKMLADTPAHRYQSATEVLQDLQSLKQFYTSPQIHLQQESGCKADCLSRIPRSPNHPEKTNVSSPPKTMLRSVDATVNPFGGIAQHPVVPTPSQINSERRKLLRLTIQGIIRIAVISGPFVLAAWLAGLSLPNGVSTREPASRTSQSEPAMLTAESAAVEPLISSGESSLIPILVTPQKQAGIAAFKAGNGGRTIEILAAYLETNRNDPEARIYLNNAQIGEQTSYTIAVAVPLGGNIKVALEQLRGVAQAQTDINQAGGVNGVPLQVVIANDNNDPTIAQRIATELTADPNVLGVVGHHASDVMLASGDIYESGKLVTISPTIALEPIKFGQYVFRTALQDRLTVEALVKGIVRLKDKTAAVFYNSQSEYSGSLASQFANALSAEGGRVLGEFDLFSPDFEAEQSYQQAIHQKVEALVLLPDNSQLDKALKVAKIAAEAGIDHRKRQIFAADTFCLSKVLEAGAETAGMIVADPWQVACDAYTDFFHAFQQFWNTAVSHPTIAAYDATQALIAAIQRYPTREGVQQALSSDGFTAKGAIGDVRFLPSGDRNHSIQLVQIAPNSNASYGYDFTPLP